MRRLLALALSIVSLALFAACGTDATGVDTCRKIETARCQRAPSCGVSLDTPPHVAKNVDGCVDYYRDACLHGLTVADPGTPAADACVNVISDGSCSYVLHPELAPECSFLQTAADAGAADAASVVEDAAIDAD
ncbi:MAG: hypothetical protein ABI551_02925, partial [Polyangiaceae bacterium]